MATVAAAVSPGLGRHDGRNTYTLFTSRSYHGTGVGVTMMDGSVQMIASGIDLTVWRALGTRAGGESVQLP